MSERTHQAVQEVAPVRAPVIQRACSCGKAAGVSGKCPACAAEARLGVQPKLAISRPDDRWEKEADRVADQVTSERWAPVTGPLAVMPLVQRQPVEEEEEEEVLQARAAGPAATGTSAATAAAARAVAGGGSPLPRTVRAFFEPRFGHGLDRVRIHTGAEAHSAARGIGARAYTLGHDIAFAAGQYRPDTPAGRHLLAHELTHTLQQSASQRERTIRRRGFFEELAGLFSSDTFSDDQLRSYMRTITRQNRIEDFTDSDNKARAIVNRLQNGADLLGVPDTPRLRSLLIREMQSGFTGNDDERAILFLLDTATVDALNAMFGRGGLTVASLESDFHGAELQQLRQFFESRFEGGRAALERSDVRAREARTPFGQMTVARARRRLAVVEELLAQAMQVDLQRQRALQSRTDLDRTASDAATAMGLRARSERAGADAMNRAPLTISVTRSRIEFRIRFHIRFEDPAMANRFSEVAATLRQGIALVWNQRLGDEVFGGRDFAMVPVIEEVAPGAARDQQYYLLTVRATDTGAVNYPGCTFDQPPPGVPTSITNSACDGGVISIPPAHITRPGVLGHETLHLFGLLDRYIAMTDMTPDGRRVTGHTNVPDRTLGRRQDPLGAQDATILPEDLAFVFDTQGVYHREIERRTGGRSVAALRVEAERLREIIRLGRDPNSLIQPRQDFNREMFRSAEDI